ncbi:MAG: alpha/beta hydrolase domain-containing protein [Acidimicrobiales bacterium]
MKSSSTIRSGALAAFVVMAMVVAACSSDSSDDVAGSDSTTSVTASDTTNTPPTTVADSTAAPDTTTTAPAVEGPDDTAGVTVDVVGPGDGDFSNRALQDLGAAGYTEREYFISGTARSYVGEDLGPDGMWAVEPDGEAEYTTRIIVRQPAAAEDFSGVVMVEWLNVSAGADGDPDWGYLHVELLREGHAYVGVSAQSTGVDTLIDREDGRYAELVHPGDEFSYDMFTQAAMVARGAGTAEVWDGIEPAQVIAAGESQSAFRMTTYANAVQPRIPGVFDGLFIHSRGANPAPLGSDGSMMADAGGATIRTDLAVPVFTFQTETDVSPRLASAAARQPDTDRLRLWEVPGTAHADAYLLERVYGLTPESDFGSLLNCDAPVNAGPHFEVISAAFHHLVAWVEDGTLPPEAPLIDTTDDDPAEVVRDADGIGTGGIRTPAVDVPVAVLSGEGQTGGGFCGLFGTTFPFDQAELVDRYGTPDDYVAAVTESAAAAAASGYLLETEVASIIETAETVEF